MLPLVLTVEDLRTKAKRTYVVRHSPVIIGRDPSIAELVIGRPSVSRGQGEFVFDDQRVAYLDHGGRNPTLLGASPVEPHDEVEIGPDARLLIGGEVEITFSRVPPDTSDEGDDPFACESAEFDLIRKEPTDAVSLEETRVLDQGVSAPVGPGTATKHEQGWSRVEETAVMPAEFAATMFRASSEPIGQRSGGGQYLADDHDQDWQERTTFLAQDTRLLSDVAPPVPLEHDDARLGRPVDDFSVRAGLTKLLGPAEGEPLAARPEPAIEANYPRRSPEMSAGSPMVARTPGAGLAGIPGAGRVPNRIVSLAIVVGTAFVVAALVVFLALR